MSVLGYPIGVILYVVEKWMTHAAYCRVHLRMLSGVSVPEEPLKKKALAFRKINGS